MLTSLRWLLLPAALLLGLLAGCPGTAGENPADRKAKAIAGEGTGLPRWEYRTLTKAQVLDLGKHDLVAGLNKVGKDGWELATVDTVYIFKRPDSQKRVEELKNLIGRLEMEVEMWQDRAAWSDRMARKGLMVRQQAEADRSRLEMTATALEKARRALQAFPADPQKAGAKKGKTEK